MGSGPTSDHVRVGEHILFKLGRRPEQAKAYSSVAGFFKSYEPILTDVKKVSPQR